MKTNNLNRRVLRFSLIVFPVLVAFALVLQSGRAKEHQIFKRTVPPGTILTSDNFYFDQTEITNFHWLEYLYWTSEVFGKNSPEYKACLPDTALWKQESTCLQPLSDFYLRHPAYRDYPVVGVSHDQAVSYCKWRSDRVFEYYLIRNGVLIWNTSETPEYHFTAERYFAGEYFYAEGNKAPNAEGLIEFPVYRLPTIEEWNKAHNYFDSASVEEVNRFRIFGRRKLAAAMRTLPVMNVRACDGVQTLGEATCPVDPFGFDNLATHLDGNVSEWLATPGTTMGGNWKDKAVQETERIAPRTATTTGFRCVCEWKPRP